MGGFARVIPAGIGLAAALTCAVAAAQTSPSNEDLQTTANLLFMRQLAKPDDLDAAFKFAQIEEQLGDYEFGDRRARAHAILQQEPASREV